jgi:hypothetical protein
MVRDPFNAEGLLTFRVSNLSAGGCCLTTSLSNKLLMPGVALADAQLILPGVGVHTATLKLIRCRVDGGSLLINASFESPGKPLLDALSAFALFGVESGEELSQLSRGIGQGVKIGPISTPEEFDQTLAVRYAAYRAADKLAPDASAETMRDIYDAEGVIFNAVADGRVMATVRLVLPSSAKGFPFQQYLPADVIPGELQNRVCEITRLAILPEWQGSDLLLHLFRKVFEYVGRTELLGGICLATDSLLPIYLRLGAKVLARNVKHPVTGETMNLLLIRKDEFIRGDRMAALCWDAVAGGVAGFLAKHDFAALPRYGLRMRLRRLIERAALRLIKSCKAMGNRGK